MRRPPAIALLALAILSCGGAAARPAAGASAPPHATAAPAPAPVSRGVPIRLAIPKLGLSAAVEPVAADQRGVMDVPRDYHDVAWYAPGVAPGEPGDAVIAGHLDWVVDGRDVPAVFWTLGSLAPGDRLSVTTDTGDVLTFSVTASQRLPADADPAAFGLFATTGARRLTLITCAGQWSAAQHRYLERLAVTAVSS
jgi:sortase (surface protein transpeptidase)